LIRSVAVAAEFAARIFGDLHYERRIGRPNAQTKKCSGLLKSAFFRLRPREIALFLNQSQLPSTNP